TSRDCADDVKRLRSRCDRCGQRRVRRFVRHIFTAREESQQWTTLARDVIANRPTQHRITRFECVEYRVACHWTINVELNISRNARKRSQMCRQNNYDHVSVWTSTESTGGRSRTMGVQVSPASADPYTCPPVVPK